MNITVISFYEQFVISFNALLYGRFSNPNLLSEGILNYLILFRNGLPLDFLSKGQSTTAGSGAYSIYRIFIWTQFNNQYKIIPYFSLDSDPLVGPTYNKW